MLAKRFVIHGCCNFRVNLSKRKSHAVSHTQDFTATPPQVACEVLRENLSAIWTALQQKQG